MRSKEQNKNIVNTTTSIDETAATIAAAPLAASQKLQAKTTARAGLRIGKGGDMLAAL